MVWSCAETSDGEKPASTPKDTPTMSHPHGHKTGFCCDARSMPSAWPLGEPASAPARRARHALRP